MISSFLFILQRPVFRKLPDLLLDVQQIVNIVEAVQHIRFFVRIDIEAFLVSGSLDGNRLLGQVDL
jgi:hypothetical protein